MLIAVLNYICILSMHDGFNNSFDFRSLRRSIIALVSTVYVVVSGQPAIAQFSSLSVYGLGYNDRQNQSFIGNVHTVSEYFSDDVIEYLAKQKSNPEFGIQTYTEFNSDGRIIRFVQFDTKGRIITEQQQLYSDSLHLTEVSELDNYGNIIRKESFVFADSMLIQKTIRIPKLSLEEVRKYTYDRNGLLEKCTYFVGDSLRGEDLYSYDKRGRIVTVNLRSEEGLPERICRYAYHSDDNRNGNLAEYVEIFQGDKEPSHVTKYSVDGLITEDIWFNAQGIEMKSDFYEYDSLNRRIGFRMELPGKAPLIERDYFDQKGNRTGIEMTHQDGRVEYTEFILDSLNRHIGTVNWIGSEGNRKMISEVSLEMSTEWLVKSVAEKNYGPEGALSGWTQRIYHRDEVGNWIRIDEFADGIATAVRARRLTYFTQ